MIKLKGTNQGYVLKIDNECVLFNDVLLNIEKFISNHDKTIPLNIEITHRLNRLEESILMDLFHKNEIIIKSYNVISEDPKKLEVIKRTIRCGEIIEIDGDCLVVGNINPEAVIKVSGFLYVLGKVMGRCECGLGLSASYINSDSVFIANKQLPPSEYKYNSITYTDQFNLKQFAFEEGDLLWEKLLS